MKINTNPTFDVTDLVPLEIPRPYVTIADLIEIVNFAYESDIPGYWEVEYTDVKKAKLTLGSLEHDYTYAFTIKDFSESDEGKEFTVDVNTVKVGIERLLNGEIKVADRILDDIRTNVYQSDLPAIDQDAVDCVIQAGLFYEIVYG